MSRRSLDENGSLGEGGDFPGVAGKRLLYRPLTGTTEVGSVGVARASQGDVTPAGEKSCEILRQLAGARSRISSVKSED